MCTCRSEVYFWLVLFLIFSVLLVLTMILMEFLLWLIIISRTYFQCIIHARLLYHIQGFKMEINIWKQFGRITTKGHTLGLQHYLSLYDIMVYLNVHLFYDIEIHLNNVFFSLWYTGLYKVYQFSNTIVLCNNVSFSFMISVSILEFDLILSKHTIYKWTL